MSRQEIELLLADADEALRAEMWYEAERLYDQAADLAVTDDDVLFNRALDGIQHARAKKPAVPSTRAIPTHPPDITITSDYQTGHLSLDDVSDAVTQKIDDSTTKHQTGKLWLDADDDPIDDASDAVTQKNDDSTQRQTGKLWFDADDDQSDTKQIQAWADEATESRKLRTDRGYQDAVRCYTHILNSDISPSQRAEYQAQLNTTQQEYTDYLAYKPLFEVREQGDSDRQLVIIQSLVYDGYDLIPDETQSLREQRETLLATKRHALLERVNTILSNAQQVQQRAIDTLDLSQLDTAMKHYSNAQSLLTESHFAHVEDHQEFSKAITQLEQLLSDYQTWRDIDQTITSHMQMVQQLKACITQMQPLYDQAKQASAQQKYAKAVHLLESALEIGGSHADWATLRASRDAAQYDLAQFLIEHARTIYEEAHQAYLEHNEALLKTKHSQLHAVRTMDLPEIKQLQIQADQWVAELAEVHDKDTILQQRLDQHLQTAYKLLNSSDSSAITQQLQQLHDDENDFARFRNPVEREQQTHALKQVITSLQQRLDQVQADKMLEQSLVTIRDIAESGDYSAAWQSLETLIQEQPENPKIQEMHSTIREHWIHRVNTQLANEFTQDNPNTEHVNELVTTLTAKLGYHDPEIEHWRSQMYQHNISDPEEIDDQTDETIVAEPNFVETASDQAITPDVIELSATTDEDIQESVFDDHRQVELVVNLVGPDQALSRANQQLAQPEADTYDHNELINPPDPMIAPDPNLTSDEPMISEQQSEPAMTQQPAQNLEQDTEKRISELVAEADFTLRTPSNANFKEAEEIFNRILGYELSEQQRQLYSDRKTEVIQQREQFLAKYGELITARQLVDTATELIQIRMRVNDGEVRVPGDDKPLAVQFTELLSAMRRKVQTSADEQVANARSAELEGVHYLEESQLDTAIEYYTKAIQLLQGVDFERPHADQATAVAIQGIKKLFDDETLQGSKVDYNKELKRLRDVKKRIPTVRNLYEQAEKELEKARDKAGYAKAVRTLDKAVREAGTITDWSRLVEARQRAWNEWERVVLVEGDKLLREANIAYTKQDVVTLHQKIDELQNLEPHLQSVQLTTRQHQAEVWLKELVDIEQGVRSEIEKAIRATHTLKLSDEISDIDAHIEQLNRTKGDLARISDRIDRNHLEQTLQQAIQDLEERKQQLVTADQQRRDIQALMVQANNCYRAGDYEAAWKNVNQVLSRDSQHTTARDLHNSVHKSWLGELKHKMGLLLKGRNSSIDEIEHTLTMMTNHLNYSDEEITGWQGQIVRLRAKHNGLDFFRKDQYQTAITELSKADSTDLDVIDTLKQARFKLGEQAVLQQQWADAVQFLKQADTSNARVKTLLDRALAENGTLQAVDARQKGEFEQALRVLQESKAHQVAALDERIDTEIERTVQSRLASQRLEALREKAASVLDQREPMLGCLNELKQVRETLTDAQIKRETLYNELTNQINQWEELYKRLISSERGDLIHRGRSAINERQPVEALNHLRKALNLSATKEDSEIEELMGQARQQLVRLRDDLVTEVNQFHKSQRVTLASCDKLLEEAKTGLEWDATRHQGLTDAKAKLDSTQRTLKEIEALLRQARESWAQERRKAHPDFGFVHAKGIISQAERLLADKTYRHADLDLGSNQNLSAVLNEDSTALKRAIEFENDLSSAIKGNLTHDSTDDLQSSFEELQKSEDHLVKNSMELSIILTGQPVSQPISERFVRQFRVTQLLVERINTGKQRLDEIENINEYRRESKLVRTLSEMFARWNADDRFNLKAKLRD